MGTITGGQHISAYGEMRAGQDLSSRATPRRGRVAGMKTDTLSKALGWFSIGLGAAELIAPRSMARLVGASGRHRTLVRAYGVREIAVGIGILSKPQRAEWMWARVAGDALDLASLGVALSTGRGPGRSVFGIASVAGVTMLDFACAKQLSGSTGSARAEANMIVNRSPEECYAFWRNFENLPRFMAYLESVRITGDRRSHWVANGPGGTRLEWDAGLESETPNEGITWRSLPGSAVDHSGTVEFERLPGGRGTIVRVQMDYGNMADALAPPAAALFGRDPEQIIRKELYRFKQVIETGEVITTEGQPSGRRSGVTWLDSVAR